MSERVLIAGLGLLGGSLGMILRRKGYAVSGWARREETRRAALACGAVDETSPDLEALLGNADLTVLALPVPEIINFLERYASCWKPGAVVTDIGSVKKRIVAAGETFLHPRGVHFAGSHPMAGTEKSSIANSFAELYANADVFVCRTGNTDGRAVDKVKAMWSSAGCSCVEIEPEPHDILVACTSHVPHILASSLALSVLETDDPEERMRHFAGCATGFRDTSRIASSSPVMWREIVESNRDAVLAAMEQFENLWNEYKNIITTGDFDRFEELFGHGRTLRDAWIKYKESKK